MRKSLFIVALVMMATGCEYFESRLETAVQSPQVQAVSNYIASATTTASTYTIDAYDYSGVAEAKAKALSTDRPLLLVASMVYCTNCRNFENRILNTEKLADYVSKNNIVVCAVKNDLLMTETSRAFRECGVNGAPYIYLFKVKEGADTTTVNAKAFGKDQVEVLASKETGLKFGGSYQAGKKFMGIDNGKTVEWNPETFIRQIKACFPNQYWDK